MSTHCHLSTTITRAPPHTTSHLPSTTITPITLSDLFLFSPTHMSTHPHLTTTITTPPPFHSHPPNFFIRSIPIPPPTDVPPPSPKHPYHQGAPPPTTSHLPSTTI